jgi:SAM-dependent methyltransferase
VGSRDYHAPVVRSRQPTDDGLRRSVALLRAFAAEQTDPPAFYRPLAEDSARLVGLFGPVEGRTVVDVGAGRPEFAAAFIGRGARYVGLDDDEPALAALCAPAVAARGEHLPLRDDSVDVAFCSNVFEHVRHPQILGDELVRVTRSGGLVVVAYTNWLSPWGGHETSPYHYLGGRRAVRRYTHRYGHPPKNRIDETLFRVSVADGLRWARRQRGTRLLCARPRYYPTWAAGVVRVPGLREVVTWNLLLVLRKV